MNEGFNDTQLLEWCYSEFGYKNFTGNEIRKTLRLNGNQVHMQLFRLYKKHPNKLGKFVRDNQIYYYIK